MSSMHKANACRRLGTVSPHAVRTKQQEGQLTEPIQARKWRGALQLRYVRRQAERAAWQR